VTRRVLLVSPHFPPDSTAGTHRARLLAPHLGEHGWEPTVLTVDARDYEGALDPALADSVPPDLRVVRTRAWPTRVTRTIGIGDLGLRAFHGLWRQASRLMASERFDALFITIYPVYPALLGPVLKKRFGVPFVLDYQDPWVGEWGRTVGADAHGHPDFKSRASRFAAVQLEPMALRAADGVTAVSRATYEQALERTPDAAPAVTAELPIGWDERDFAFLRTHRPTSALIPSGDGLVHIAYVGTLLPTGIETLRAFCAALALARERDRAAAMRLRVHFFGTSNLRSSSAPARVLPVARACGVADLVTERPERLDYFDALQTLVDASAVLLIGSNEPHYTPSKVFPAMLSGRPLLAIYHAESTATALLRRFGQPPAVRVVSYSTQHSAIACIDEIAAHLCEMVQHPAERAVSVNRGVLEPASARSLAGRFAEVLERASVAGSVAAASVKVATR
jgi:glycosyltransferase involved in cell wall biosynthesis